MSLKPSLIIGVTLSLSLFATEIEDPALRACIDEQVKLSDQEPTQLESLKCHDRGVRSLSGIEQLINLKQLSLYKNDIDQLPEKLPEKLEVLNLAANRLTSVSLNKLERLKTLYLFRNELKEMTLSELPALEELKANNNRMIQVVFKNVSQLKKLFLFDNQLEDLALEPLASVTYMDVRHNPMPDELYDKMDQLRGVTVLHDGNADDW